MSGKNDVPGFRERRWPDGVLECVSDTSRGERVTRVPDGTNAANVIFAALGLHDEVANVK